MSLSMCDGGSAVGHSVEEYYRDELGLVPPEGLADAYDGVPASIEDLLYRPGLTDGAPPSLEWAIAEANQSSWPLEPGFVPLMGVDEASFACVVATPIGAPLHRLHGQVVRWHLTTEKAERQSDVLDTSVEAYVQSVAEELAYRDHGFNRMVDEIGPMYETNYLSRDKRPRAFVIRPVRLACQNVIVGLAAFGQDASIDGLSVYTWQTCEVPHVATHDANRAMTALMLCDAFKNGGTMEIRFDRPGKLPAVELPNGKSLGPFEYAGHPENGRVPESLRRFARMLDLPVGVDDPCAISPREARDLFIAVTPMPAELRARVHDAVARGLATPERLCFTLMSSGLWNEIELDFLLASSDRSKSILEGGSNWQLRAERQAEAQLARAARMIGMLYRRLDTLDAAAADGDARVLEDNRVGVTWSVIEDFGAVLFQDALVGAVPWQASGSSVLAAGDCLVAVPRPCATQADVDLVRSLQADGILPVLVVPGDAYRGYDQTADGVDCSEITVLVCPERLGELDLALEVTMLTSRITRQ